MTLEQLQRIACSEQMIPGTSVVSSRAVLINAAREQVWRIQTDIRRWPEWYAYLSNAEIDGSFNTGAKLSYGSLFKHRLRIAKVRDQELVTIYGKYMGFSGVTLWQFQDVSRDKTKVTFTESSSGFLMSTLYSSDKLAEHLDAWLAHLKRAAEGC